jgi:hypothetical protein
MTTPNEPTPVDEPDELDDDEQVFDMRAVRKLRRENSSLRSRIHDFEEQLRDRDEQIGAQAAREAAHQRSVIEAAARAAGLIDPSDFLAAHPDPSEFIDAEFRDVLPDKVAEAAAALLEAKPYLGRPVGAPPSDRPLEALRSGARPADKPKPASWTTAIRGGGA